jgi:hypothetical protein
MATEYGYRFCCEEGLRDAKWDLGFAQARLKAHRPITFGGPLRSLTSLGRQLLIRGGSTARAASDRKPVFQFFDPGTQLGDLSAQLLHQTNHRFWSLVISSDGRSRSLKENKVVRSDRKKVCRTKVRH